MSSILFKLKACFIGDKKAGKTTIIQHFLNKEGFEKKKHEDNDEDCNEETQSIKYIPTIDIKEYPEKEIPIGDDKALFTIIDTPGNDTFKMQNINHFLESDCCYMVFNSKCLPTTLQMEHLRRSFLQNNGYNINDDKVIFFLVFTKEESSKFFVPSEKIRRYLKNHKNFFLYQIDPQNEEQIITLFNLSIQIAMNRKITNTISSSHEKLLKIRQNLMINTAHYKNFEYEDKQQLISIYENIGKSLDSISLSDPESSYETLSELQDNIKDFNDPTINNDEINQLHSLFCMLKDASEIIYNSMFPQQSILATNEILRKLALLDSFANDSNATIQLNDATFNINFGIGSIISSSFAIAMKNHPDVRCFPINLPFVSSGTIQCIKNLIGDFDKYGRSIYNAIKSMDDNIIRDLAHFGHKFGNDMFMIPLIRKTESIVDFMNLPIKDFINHINDKLFLIKHCKGYPVILDREINYIAPILYKMINDSDFISYCLNENGVDLLETLLSSPNIVLVDEDSLVSFILDLCEKSQKADEQGVLRSMHEVLFSRTKIQFCSDKIARRYQNYYIKSRLCKLHHLDSVMIDASSPRFIYGILNKNRQVNLSRYLKSYDEEEEEEVKEGHD